MINSKVFLLLILCYITSSLGCGPREPNAETIKYDLDKHFISLALWNHKTLSVKIMNKQQKRNGDALDYRIEANMVGNASSTSNRRRSATIEFVVTYRKTNGAWQYAGEEQIKVIKQTLE
ncbi:MAG: hypothetical protein OXI43_03920 [Candidatus Poribacteria bacterium]|nr:hypothetical protein [Candidatus Poribacteria bacterium]